MTDELVKRLRGDWFGYDVSLKAMDAMDEAANRIEGLEENQRFIIRERDRTFALMLARAEKAEAERDRWQQAFAAQSAKLQIALDVGGEPVRAALKGESHD